MIPDWVRRRSDQMREARAAQVAMDTDDGWRIVGDAFYTCIRPADQPVPDQAMLANARAFDPGVMPIWEKRWYLPPGAPRPILVTRAGLARHVRDPRGDRYLMHVEMPSDATDPRPNLLDPGIFEAADETKMHHGGPGAFKPLDGRIYRWMRRRYEETKAAKARIAALAAERRAAQEKAIRAFAEQMVLIERDFERWAGKKLEHATRREYREYRAKKLAEARAKSRDRRRRPSMHMTGAHV